MFSQAYIYCTFPTWSQIPLENISLQPEDCTQISQSPRGAFTVNLLVMAWNSTHLQRVLGQVLGDPLHRERCIWVADDGNHCQNTVPIESRINGVLCFQLFQTPPSANPPVQKLSLAAKQLLCFECRRHSCRPKVWANRLLRMLDARPDQAKNAIIHHLSETMPYRVDATIQSQGWYTPY